MNAENQKYVVVVEHDKGGLFCLGISNDYHKAIGVAMENIWNFQGSYQDDGDIFEYTQPYMIEGDGGYCICVKYKAASWSDEPRKEYYYILFTEDE